MKVQRPQKKDIKTINKLAKKYRTFMIVVEPVKKTSLSGYKIFKGPYLPSKTLILDLTKSQKKLLSGMHHKTRYNIKIAQKRGVRVKQINDINLFADFWNEQRHGKHAFFSQKNDIRQVYKALGEEAKIVAAYEDKELISAILMLMCDKTAYYMYAASSPKGKKLFTPTLIAWESIKLAKKLGYKIYDFEGIYDDRFPIESWHGFSRFKKSFGGTEISHPPSLVKYRLPL